MERNDQVEIAAWYSFPHRIGAGRICYTAWQQVRGLSAAGIKLSLHVGSVAKPVDTLVNVRPTLSWGRSRLPYRVFGNRRLLRLHDRIVARRLARAGGSVSLVHLWPSAALNTLRAAKAAGVVTVMERPNAHTRYAYEIVDRECRRLGIRLPRDDEYAYRDDVLRAEEEEFALADYLLCPSEFVARTFLERGFRPEKLLLHQYGFDQKRFVPVQHERRAAGDRTGLTMLFAGDCSVRKGLHFALEAWLGSSACRTGKFRIAGRFLPEYERKLARLLRDPSIEVLGFRKDLPRIMQESDLFILPSLEEGSALVTSEARGAGCVLLVSDASGARCTHGLDGLVHPIGDVATLTQQLSSLHQDRDLLNRLRAASVSTTNELTWDAAAIRLAQIYRQVATM